MQIIDMQRSEREGNIKAFFKVQTHEGFVIEGFKIMNGKNGLFISMPSRKVGERFVDTVTSTSRELKQTLSRLALAEYENLPPVTSGGGIATTPGEMPMPDSDLPF